MNYINQLNSDENLIKLFEVDESKYLYAYNRLAEKYTEMKEFVFPQYHIQDKKQDYNFKTVFNCMLNAFKKMLVNCPYLCILTGFKPDNEAHEYEKEFGIQLMPILDEYAIQDKEANDPMKLNLIYYDDGMNFHNETLPYFTKFAKTLEKRHQKLFKMGIVAKPFTYNLYFNEMDKYLKGIKENLDIEKKQRKVELDREQA